MSFARSPTKRGVPRARLATKDTHTAKVLELGEPEMRFLLVGREKRVAREEEGGVSTDRMAGEARG